MRKTTRFLRQLNYLLAYTVLATARVALAMVFAGLLTRPAA